MTIESFDIAGYRCFRDRQTLSLGRLTLLYGRNNAGKSALIRLPALIAGSMKNSLGLDLQNPVVKGASFKQLVWRQGSEGHTLDLGLTIANLGRWGWELEWKDNERQGVPVKISVPENGGKTWTWKPASRNESDETRTFVDENDISAEITFSGLCPEFQGHSVAEMTAAVEAIHCLTALRAGPSRNGLPEGARPPLTPDGGEGAEGALQEEAMLSSVSAFFEKNMGYRLVLEPVAANTRIVLQLTGNTAPNTPFPDVGEGLQQVLPVVVALEHLRRKGGLFCIEEPESHLHPGLQEALARHMVEVLAENEHAQLLLETHSEIFLYAALLGAVEGLKDGVVLHWVQAGSDGASVIETVPLDEKGRPTNDKLRMAFEDVGDLRRKVIEARRNHAG